MQWSDAGRRAATGLVAVGVLSSVVGCGGDEESGGAEAVPDGVESLTITSREHTDVDVDYPTVPPAGGDHLGIWHNCGLYTV